MIFHLAAIPSISRKNKKKFLDMSWRNKNLILCAKKNKITKIIYTSGNGLRRSRKILKEEDAGNTIGFYKEK